MELQATPENLELFKEFLALMQFATAFLVPALKEPLYIFLAIVAFLIFWLLRTLIKKQLSVHYKSLKTEIIVKEEIIETGPEEPEEEETKPNEPENHVSAGVISP